MLLSNIGTHCKAYQMHKHYKKYMQQYDILPAKIHDLKPWTKVCINMICLWMIAQDDKKKKPKSKDKPIIDIQELLVLTCLDPNTNFIKMIALVFKFIIIVARAFNERSGSVVTLAH
jgi:exosome complex RNA-binding protein Rrp4